MLQLRPLRGQAPRANGSLFTVQYWITFTAGDEFVLILPNLIIDSTPRAAAIPSSFQPLLVFSSEGISLSVVLLELLHH